MPRLNRKTGKHWLLAMLLGIVSTAGAVEPGQSTREVLQAEADVCCAFEVGNADALRHARTAGFTLVDSRGNVTNLEQNLAGVAAR
jgi:hypothetical protein